MNTRMMVILAIPLIAATGGSARSFPVYFGTYTGSGSEGIYHSVFDLETGKLSEPVLVAELRNPSFLEIHSSGAFLYAVSEAGRAGTVGAYAIDRDTGGLKSLNMRPSGGSGHVMSASTASERMSWWPTTAAAVRR